MDVTSMDAGRTNVRADSSTDTSRRSDLVPGGLVEGDMYAGQCPILYAMDLIGQKWKLPILWYIADKGPIRYNELRRDVVGITPTMLTKCLGELEEAGLIERHQFPEIPPHVEYSLTPDGESLLPTLREL